MRAELAATINETVADLGGDGLLAKVGIKSGMLAPQQLAQFAVAERDRNARICVGREVRATMRGA